MTESKHAEELNRAADRLAEVTNELSEVLECLVKLQRRESQSEKGARKQPRPRVPLLTGGKDPTLAERFEDELHGSGPED